MAITYEAIATQTASGSSNTVTFSSIPQTYTDLVLIKNGGNSESSNSYIRFNGDSGSNYSATGLYGDGSTAASYRDTNVSNIVIDFFSTSGLRSMTIFNVMNYSNTTTYKSGIYRRTDTFNATLANAFLWRNTNAITSLSIHTTSGFFDNTTTFTLYGIASA